MKAHTLARRLLKGPNIEVLTEVYHSERVLQFNTVKNAGQRRVSDGGTSFKAIVINAGRDTYYFDAP